MSAQPASTDPQPPVTPLRRQWSRPSSHGATSGDAQALLPRGVLVGCREAIQRIDDDGHHSYGITSALRGEGRSSIAAGFALVEWLDYERRTVLVDLDLEGPSLHERFGLPEGPGISDLVGSHDPVEDYLQRLVGDVWLLSAGGDRENVPRTLSRLTQGTVMSQLAEWADVVICDLPPLLGSPTGLEAARLCSTAVMVVRAGVTPMPRVKEAADSLATPPPVILNGVHSSVPAWIRRATGDWKP
jgi:Mrp family chromosome partitioning ATPase